MSELDELEAMKMIAAALERLDDEARSRALQWALSKYRGGKAVVPAVAISERSSEIAPSTEASTISEFAELFEAANPSSDKEKALVAAYWTQICEHNSSFAAQVLNGLLKDLGHRVGNITEALTQLKNDRPALVLQLKKSGTSRQARKTYKLTTEGAKRVSVMMRIGSSDID